jgi:aryl-alcohol dehydrogenase-like predicted oxidoreductase
MYGYVFWNGREGGRRVEYRLLGSTGVRVSPLCLGAMMFGPVGNPDEAECIRMVHRSLDAGINFIDTANVYSSGASEEIVGKALVGRRAEVVLATKVHGRMGPGPNDRGNSRRHILQAVEESLRRLRTDWIDLYQLHRPDPDTPIEETLLAMDHLVSQGKVRYVGTSTFPAWQITQAALTARHLGFAPVATEQPPYSLLRRGVEREVLPACRALGIAVLPWGPLHGGELTGKYRPGAPPPAGSRRDRRAAAAEDAAFQARLALVDELRPVAEAAGLSLSQFSLAWLLAQDGVTSPIIGPRTPDQLEDNLGAMDARPAAELLARASEITADRVHAD